MNKVKQLQRSSAAALRAQVMTEKELQQCLAGGQRWATFDVDDQAERGKPRMTRDELNPTITMHPDDLLEMEQFAVEQGFRIRAVGALLEMIGRDQPYDVAMGYQGDLVEPEEG